MQTALTAFDMAAWAVVRCSVQATVLIPFVLGIRWLCGVRLGPAGRWVVWWVVVGRLLLPWSPSASFSLFGWLGDQGAAWTEAALPRAVRAEVIGVGRSGVNSVGGGVAVDSAPRGEVEALHTGSSPSAVVLRWTAMRRLISILWGVGFAVMLGRIVLDAVSLRRFVRSGTAEAGPETQALVEECRRQLGVRASVSVRVGSVVRTPAVWGFWRPALLLPAEVESGRCRAQIRHILLHELAHVARSDTRWGLLLRFVQALHWFNPIVPWLLRRMKLDREIATDRRALEALGTSERTSYGETLLTLASRGSERDASWFGAASLGTADGEADMEARIRAIATFAPVRGSARLAVAVVVVLAMVGWTQARSPVVPDPKPRLESLARGIPERVEEWLPTGAELGPAWSNRVTTLIDRGSPSIEYFDPAVLESGRAMLRSRVPEGGVFCDVTYSRGGNAVFDVWLQRHTSTNEVEAERLNRRNRPFPSATPEGTSARRSVRPLGGLEAIVYEGDLSRTVWLAVGPWTLNLMVQGNLTVAEILPIAERFAHRLRGLGEVGSVRTSPASEANETNGWYVVHAIGGLYTPVRRVHTNRVWVSSPFAKPDGSAAWYTITNAESVPIIVWNVRVQVKANGKDAGPSGWRTVHSDYPSGVSHMPPGTIGHLYVVPPSEAPWRIAVLYTAQSLDGKPIPNFPPHLRGDHEVTSLEVQSRFE